MKLIKLYLNKYLGVLLVLLSLYIKEMIFNSCFGQGLNIKVGFFDTFALIFIYFTSSLLLLTKNKALHLLLHVNTFMSVLMFANIIFYRAYGDLLSIGVLFQVNQVESVKSSIFSLLYLKDFILLADLPLLYYIIYKKINLNEIKIKTKLIGLVCSLLICIMFCMTLIARNPNLGKAEIIRRDLFQYYGNIGLVIMDNYNYVTNNLVTTPMTEKEEKNINQELNTSKSGNKQYLGKNLIMIQVESLQEFVIGKKYNGKEITPNLNKIINDSAYFNNCYYQIGLGHTSDAEVLSNTGLYPYKDGAAHMIKYNNKYNALAGLFDEKGYNTYAFHGNKGDYWNRNIVFRNYGFSKYFDLNTFKNDEIIDMGLSDQSFFRQSYQKMKELKEPFYSFLITITSHSPFSVNNDKPFCDTKTIVGKYYNAINYTDKCIGEFLDDMEKDGLLNNSIVVIFGDHNALTMDLRDKLFEEVKEDSSSNIAWQKYQKVPLIIRFPNKENKGIYNNSIGQIDIMTTVLDVFGIEEVKTFGHNVFDGVDNQVVLRNGSYVFGDTFYDKNTNSTYDMTTENKMKNNDKMILQAQNILKASDDIYKYNYFSK